VSLPRGVDRGGVRARSAWATSAAAFAAAVVVALWFLFGPTYTTCQTTSIGPEPQGSTPAACRSVGGLEANRAFPGPYPFITAWTLAPLVAHIGVRRWRVGLLGGRPLVAVGTAIAASCVISFGYAWPYLPLVLPLLLVTLLLTARRVV
jgi:hypothetical protein